MKVVYSFITQLKWLTVNVLANVKNPLIFFEKYETSESDFPAVRMAPDWLRNSMMYEKMNNGCCKVFIVMMLEKVSA